MDTDFNNIQTKQSVVALTRTNGVMKAIELRKRPDGYELLWAKSSTEDNNELQLFATECGLTFNQITAQDEHDKRMFVVGYDSTGIAFYRMKFPVVEEKEITAMVRLQAETRLPLPANQMELTWRTGRTQNGQVNVTMVAARKEQLQRFISEIGGYKPRKILLNSEAIVKVWRTFFSGTEKDAVVMSIEARNTHICLVEDGRLCNTVVLDMGTEDFNSEEADQQAEAIERFTLDVKSVMELFGYSGSKELPLFVLSSNSDLLVNIVNELGQSGLNIRSASVKKEELKTQNDFGPGDIYNYRIPIGLGLIGLDREENEINIFKQLYNPEGKEKKKNWIYAPKITGAIAAVTLIMFIIISYATLIAKADAIEKRLSNSETKADINMLVEKQKLIKTVASQRPDLLDLLNEINESAQRGIQLESLHFKKGQLVTITGQASGNNQLYRFEESLEARKDIREVNRTATQDARNRGLKFSITFHYRNFTK